MNDHDAMLIALLTDFGTRDPYVAAMKGAIVSRCDAAIHDLSHDLPPHDVWAAAFFLRDIVAHWPAGAIFCCAVDPGVGTSRRVLAVESEGRFFLAPDNGLLTFIDGAAHELRGEVEDRAPELTIFAPAAAALANGANVDSLGPRIEERVKLAYDPPCYTCDRIEATIVAVDRFGNCITDIEVARIVFPRFALQAGSQTIVRFARSYAAAGEGPFVIAGSTGRLEISVANASAAALLQLSRGDCVTLIPH
jgi:S-adenosylmethionine hydrolase